MKLKFVQLIVLFLLAILLINCAGNGTQISDQSDQYYFRGKQAYEQEKWLKAIDNFKLFILNNPGSQYADTAQFLLGESYYNNKEYLLAISEYRQLTNKYSYSPLSVKGSYKMAKSYVQLSPNYHLDQENTRRAIRYCQSFISNYPESEYVDEIEKDIQKMRNKLAHKLYKNGVLYRKMHHWESAVIYFDEMLDNYYDTKWALDSKLEKALCLVRMRKFDEYKQVLVSIKNNNEIDNELKTKLADLQNEYRDEKNQIAKEQEKREGRF